MDYNFNSLDTATHGLISGNSFTISVQGLLSYVEIEEITSPILPGSSYYPIYKKQKKDEKLYKIKVVVFINGERYEQEKLVNKKIKPKIEDIKLNITESNKISIKLLK